MTKIALPSMNAQVGQVGNLSGWQGGAGACGMYSQETEVVLDESCEEIFGPAYGDICIKVHS